MEKTIEITEDYVSFEVAKLLKEKGFNQECDYATSWYAKQYYKNSCQGEWFEGEHQIIEDMDDKCNVSYLSEEGIFIPAPTLQVAMKWLREVHNIGIFPTTFYRHTETFDGHNYGCTLVNLKTFEVIGKFEDCTFPADSYEETCEAAIKYCLENLI